MSTELGQAARSGEVDAVRAAIRAGADLDARDDRPGTPEEFDAEFAAAEGEIGPIRFIEWFRSGRAPLQHAPAGGHVGVVVELIAAGAKLDAADALGYTAAMLALLPRSADGSEWSAARDAEAAPGDEACALALIAAGAGVDARSWRGETALILAADRGADAVVARLIEAGAGFDAVAGDGRTALERAIQGGHDAVARRLLEAGASPHPGLPPGAAGPFDWSPLMWACRRADPELVRLLLERGADPHARDARGQAPLHFAAGGDICNSYSRRSEDGFRPRPLDVGWSGGSGAAIRHLVAAGADVEARDEEGHTPLMRATHRGHLDAALALLEVGADVDAPLRPRPLTPIEMGILSVAERYRGQMPGADLPPAPADADAAAGVGATALVLACQWEASDARFRDPFLHDRTPIVRALLAAGADVLARKRGGSTALGYALEVRAIILRRPPADWPPIPQALLDAALPKADALIALLRAAGATD